MIAFGRYLRLYLALARYGLLRELTFRSNFLVKIVVEVMWLGILLIFYETVFRQTSMVADWNEMQFLFFIGCYFSMGGIIEMLFLENCNQFAELIRTGDLDFYLLKPIDEQFLVTCRNIDWSTGANAVMGAGIMVYSLWQMDWQVDVLKCLLFVVLFACGVAMAYGFLVLLTSASVWFMRNQSLYEMWWLFTTLMRYPSEIYRSWAEPVAWFFSFVVPIMLVTNVPARVMVKSLHPGFVGITLLATVVVLFVSRRFFQFALTRYRSASS